MRAHLNPKAAVPTERAVSAAATINWDCPVASGATRAMPFAPCPANRQGAGPKVKLMSKTFLPEVHDSTKRTLKLSYGSRQCLLTGYTKR